jgi:molecular chaperone Hsp33
MMAATALADDRILPFAVEALDVRGRVVRLGPMIDAILAGHAYPPPVSRTLGEAVALTVLLGSSLKLEGRFQMQTRSDGPVSLLVVDYDAPDSVRGYARFDAARVDEVVSDGKANAAGMLGAGHLAFTIDRGGAMQRYQGVVALEGQGLEQAAHEYFLRSEQIPTRVRLAVAESFRGSGTAARGWRAGGLLVQFLPEAPERQRQPDLDPGRKPEGWVAPVFKEDEAWIEARALVETIEDHELVDPTLESERLLYRLFHERGVRVFSGGSVQHRCRCSRERIVDMLRSFSPEERREMIADDGRIVVTCEFCSKVYPLAPEEVPATDDA